MRRIGAIVFILATLTSSHTTFADNTNLASALQKRVQDTLEKVIPAFVFVESGGSGVLISEDGLFLTNYHVAGRLKTVKVNLANGERLDAKKIAGDPEGDIALFKIDKEGKFKFVELGDSDTLEIGEYVIAVGDPFVLSYGSPTKQKDPSVSLGIISAIHRNQGSYSDAIQTDAAINPGNSGGPLLTLDGKLIGINGRIAPRFFNRINSGVGYAIPVNQIKRFLDGLKSGGEKGVVYHGEIDGLRISHVFANGEGAKVSAVKKGSTADNAGFKKGDLIIQLDDYRIFSEKRFIGALGSYPAGATITIKVKREKVKEENPEQENPDREKVKEENPESEEPEREKVEGGKSEHENPAQENAKQENPESGNSERERVKNKNPERENVDREKIKQQQENPDREKVKEENPESENPNREKVEEKNPKPEAAPLTTINLKVTLDRKSTVHEMAGYNPPRRPNSGWLGIRTADSPEGAEITDVVPGSPADDAGIQVGDIVTKFDGKRVVSGRRLVDMLIAKDAGDKVDITVLRGSETIEFEDVELVSRPGSDKQEKKGEDPAPKGKPR